MTRTVEAFLNSSEAEVMPYEKLSEIDIKVSVGVLLKVPESYQGKLLLRYSLACIDIPQNQNIDSIFSRFVLSPLQIDLLKGRFCTLQRYLYRLTC